MLRRGAGAALGAVLLLASPALGVWPVAGTGTTTGTAVLLPAAPGGLTATVTGCVLGQAALDLTWTPVAGATGYRLARTVAGVTTTTLVAGTSAVDVALLAAPVTWAVTAVTGTWAGPASGAVVSPGSC